MSELTNARSGHDEFRRRLLLTASAFVLVTQLGQAAKAADSDQHPTVWIELGGQLSRLNAGQEAFSPELMNTRPAMFDSSPQFERSPLFSAEESGKITFQPDSSNWSFTASIRYGRSTAKKDHHQQTYPKAFNLYYASNGQFFTAWQPYAAKFADTTVRSTESHLVLDFQVGKDVGLGAFGSKQGTAVISAGVRFAQFTSQSNIALKSDPDWHFVYTYVPSLASFFNPTRFPIQQPYHTNLASLQARRSFHGIGPAIAWSASMPVTGTPQAGELSFDWGINAAVLFGRQKAKTQHQTTANYGYGYFRQDKIQLSQHSTHHTRSRGVAVPNVGGFAGLSFRYDNAKVALGYRADFFFGAMDAGIDKTKSYDRNFYGPFASISVGLGN